MRQDTIIKKLFVIYFSILLFFIAGISTCQASRKLSDYPQIAAFIQYMSVHDHYDAQYLKYLFNHSKLSAEVLQAMNTPYEAHPWHAYRNYFLGQKRVMGGVKYWRRHLHSLNYAAQMFGVPEQIITAIVGVESSYGEVSAKYPELNTLLTLSFAYPRRADFFQMELEQYLLLTRELNVEPRALRGSYAGALGLPQFMPSNYRAFAISFNETGVPNLFADNGDVVLSVANFLKQKGWHRGERVAVRAWVKGAKYRKVLSNDAKPKLTIAQLRKFHVYPAANANAKIAGSNKAALIKLHGINGDEYWLVFNNFYVLTKYNGSNNYVMAVYQLSQAIRQAMYKKP